MSEKNLKPWLIISPNGSISSAHCTCMAGLGEVCSHVAAIAFSLHFKNRSDDMSCTDKLSVWLVPAAAKTVHPKKVSEINWGKKKQCSGKLLSFYAGLKLS